MARREPLTGFHAWEEWGGGVAVVPRVEVREASDTLVGSPMACIGPRECLVWHTKKGAKKYGKRDTRCCGE